MKGIKTQKIGKVTPDKKLSVKGVDRTEIIDVSILSLSDAFRKPMYKVLGMKF